MARPEVKAKLVALKGNGNGFKSGKLNPMYGRVESKASAWKGNDVGYGGIHYWVNKWKGSPKECFVCGEIKNRVAWANIDHKYRRILDDYIRLCPKCHTDYDKKNGLRFARSKNFIK